MTDTHTHPYLEQFAGDEAAAIQRAIDAGVDCMVLPCVDRSSIGPMARLQRQYPDNTILALGLHPTELTEDWREDLADMEILLDTGDFAAIGEIGMDLYWDKSNEENQREAFLRQLKWGAERQLPVLIHCRDAQAQLLDAIREFKTSNDGKLPPLVFHSFTGGPEDVAAIREVCDPWFGINGVVTFKNAPKLREALPAIGLGRILLETDAPYLAPVPHRGERNEPAYVQFVRNAVAATLGITPEAVEEATDANARTLGLRR